MKFSSALAVVLPVIFATATASPAAPPNTQTHIYTYPGAAGHHASIEPEGDCHNFFGEMSAFFNHLGSVYTAKGYHCELYQSPECLGFLYKIENADGNLFAGWDYGHRTKSIKCSPD